MTPPTAIDLTLLQGARVTRLELLKIVVSQARANGFEFRRWYTGRLAVPWISTEAALTLLESQRRYYALLFSHDFACHFWKPGSDITFSIPESSFARRMPDGSQRIIQRKPFTRRSARPDAWRYHLRQMATAEDPLRYIRKYLNVEDELDEDELSAAELATSTEAAAGPLARSPARAKPVGRPLPTDLPAFLRRPYP